MSTEVTKSESLLEEWKARSGGIDISDKVNRIIFRNSKMDEDGNLSEDYGKLIACRYDGDEEMREEIKFDEDLFLVKVRSQIKCRDIGKDGKPKYWAREMDHPNDYMDLMNADGEVVVSGEYRDLKEEYNLKYTDSAYVYYKGNIYRFNIMWISILLFDYPFN